MYRTDTVIDYYDYELFKINFLVLHEELFCLRKVAVEVHLGFYINTNMGIYIKFHPN